MALKKNKKKKIQRRRKIKYIYKWPSARCDDCTNRFFFFFIFVSSFFISFLSPFSCAIQTIVKMSYFWLSVTWALYYPFKEKKKVKLHRLIFPHPESWKRFEWLYKYWNFQVFSFHFNSFHSIRLLINSQFQHFNRF